MKEPYCIIADFESDNEEFNQKKGKKPTIVAEKVISLLIPSMLFF